MIILYCVLSIALWKLIIFCYHWIYIFLYNSDSYPYNASYFVLIISFGLTYFFLKNVKRDTKIGNLYWWILLIMVFKVITIPFGYIVIESAFQGVLLLCVLFILGIPLSVILTNYLFTLIKKNSQ